MWKLFYDGACQGNPGITGLGASLVSPDGKEIASIAKAGKFGTNNTAEYDALYVGLKLALHHNVHELTVYGDSQLVTNQVIGKYKCEKPELKERLAGVRLLLEQFKQVRLVWVRRNQNKRADELSKQGLLNGADEEEPVSMVAIPHPGIGFTVIDRKKIYAVNFNPELNCSCGTERSVAECRHIRYLKSLSVNAS